LKNIFVGNLDFNTSEDELRQLFSAHGQVDRVSILTDRETGRSRGFGFVEMISNEEGDKAIAALNGSQLGGRTLNVNEARPKVERVAVVAAEAADVTAAGVVVAVEAAAETAGKSRKAARQRIRFASFFGKKTAKLALRPFPDLRTMVNTFN